MLRKQSQNRLFFGRLYQLSLRVLA
jgi:hypothetical protein